MFKDIYGASWKYKIVKIAKIQELSKPILLNSHNWPVKSVGVETSNLIVPIILEYTYLYKQLESINIEHHKLDTSKSNPIETYVKYGNYISDLKVGDRFTLGIINIFDSWITSDVKFIINNNLFITKNSVYFIYDQAIYRDEQLKKLLE